MGRSVKKLLTVDPSALSRDDQLDGLAAIDQLLNRVSARRERFLAAVAEPDDPKNWTREEIGALLRWSYPYTQARLAQSQKLVRDLPATLALHETGVIGEAHTRALCDATYGVDQALTAKIESRVLERAAAQTPTEFKRAITRAVNTLDPRGCAEKHQAAKKDRGAWVRPLPDGMAGIYSIHDAVDAEAIMTRVAALAAKIKARRLPGDDRGPDERRADVLRDLILGTGTGSGCPEADLPTQHGRKPTVNIVVPLDVALGLSDLPGELIGFGPIPASMCREALADPSARLRRLVVNDLGQLVDCSTSYEPSQALTDKIIMRDRYCRFPGCHRKACTCELDHITPFDGSNTVETNLHALCCRHHHGKHDHGWTPIRHPDGTTEWTSPTGRKYIKPPDPYPGAEPQPPPPD